MCADAAAEKNTRASFKAAVDRRLSRKAVVILDAPNYIKGFRCAICQVAQTLPPLRLLPFRSSWQAASSTATTCSDAAAALLTHQVLVPPLGREAP